MTSSRFFGLLVMSALVSLVIGAIYSLPALAAESLRVSPTKGAIGDEINVRGSGYDRGDRAFIYFSSRKARVGDDIEELGVWERLQKASVDDGDINASFDVPDELKDGGEIEEVRPGEYYVYSTYGIEGKIRAIAEFAVTGISLLYPAASSVGAKVMVRGVGFHENEDIELFYDGDEIEIASGNDKTDTKGNFVLTIFIPPSPAGTHAITVEIDKDKGEAMFVIEPGIHISTTSGMVRDSVTITGTGFGENVEVSITFGGTEVGIARTDKNGSFAIDFDVPSVGLDTYYVEAKDENDNSAKAEFTLTTGVSINPVTSQASPGHVGMDVAIEGIGFIPKTTVTITYTSAPVVVAVTESKADGSFSASFKIPESEAGEHTITASDGINSLEVAFFMESEAPAIPQPLLPAIDTKPEHPITFKWQDVTDASGVTYTLQVAKDKNFASIVLEKEGLTQPEYTLTEDEGLGSTKKDAPYWWRVMAIDGASNMSGWSAAKSFTVGFVLTIPNWTKYLLGALGGLLLFLIGFLLVRRRGKAT